MPSLIGEERLEALAAEVKDMHIRAKVDAHQTYLGLRRADENYVNAKIVREYMERLHVNS